MEKGQAIMIEERPDNVAVLDDNTERHESYFQLVWRRFKRSKVSILGALMVVMLLMMAIFADFFSPTALNEIDLQAAFTPPHQIHFFMMQTVNST